MSQYRGIPGRSELLGSVPNANQSHAGLFISKQSQARNRQIVFDNIRQLETVQTVDNAIS